MPARRTGARDVGGRRALIDATVAAIEADGLAGVSLRAIARRAAVSHAAPAHHFRDKAGLFTAVAVEGFELLAATLAGADRGRGGIERVQALGAAYVGFARAHRAHFEVMFRPELVTPDDPGLLRAGLVAFGLLQEALAEARAEGFGATWSLEELTLATWSTVHGVVQLTEHGVLDQLGLEVDAVALAHRLTELLGQAITTPVDEAP